MNYTTKSGVPTAHITKKKSRLKVYNGNKVFLSNGDNFEFELYNPTNKSVLVRIKLNGDYISTSGVIIKPGQRVFLERFLDSNNKFEFSTYDVENTPENRSAIDLNGDVRIEFYNQQEISILNGSTWSPSWSTVSTNSPYLYGSNVTTNNVNGTFTTTSSYFSVNTLYLNQNIETGRVEKGDSSNQSFTNSYDNFSGIVSKYYNFKILPLGKKNLTTEEIRQYCTECGTKIKKKFKFCPSCGNEI